MTASLATAFFESRSMKNHIKAQEDKGKNVENFMKAVNNVVIAVGNLGKAIAGR